MREQSRGISIQSIKLHLTLLPEFEQKQVIRSACKSTQILNNVKIKPEFPSYSQKIGKIHKRQNEEEFIKKKMRKKIKLGENEVHHCLWSTVHKVSLFRVHGFGFQGEKKQASFHASCPRLQAELSCSLGGRLHSTHCRCSDSPLLQSVKPVDGCPTWGADL